jgi:hypothetical protein
LFGAVLEVKELPDGYAFRLPVSTDTLMDTAAFIANERLCCPFLVFNLTVEEQSAALWLSVTGRGEVKAFVRAEFSGVLGEKWDTPE